MSFDLKNLEEAVLLFYQSDAKKKESTHEFLMQMQESPMAWQFAWDLMLPQKVRNLQNRTSDDNHTSPFIFPN